MLDSVQANRALERLADSFLNNTREIPGTCHFGWGQFVGPTAGTQVGLYGTCAGLIVVASAYAHGRIPQSVIRYLTQLWRELGVGSNAVSGTVAQFENSTGSCYINPTTTSLSCSSDIRLKTNVSSLSASFGLDALLQLNPVTFNWIREASGRPTHSGFIAQDVEKVLPDLISKGTDGYYTMNYAGLVTYIVKAIQQFAAKVSDLAATVANFADHFTTKELTFDRASGKQLCLQKSDATAICVTGDELAAMLAAANLAASPSGQESGNNSATSSSTPPVIIIVGNNPAIINIGDTYQDLGATAKDSEGHDLGVKTFLNGLLVSDIVLDTSTTTTNTIDYVATDATGLTATSTRTAIVEIVALHGIEW